MNVKVLGTNFTVTSSLKLEDIKKIQKYAPEGLQLKNEDKEVVFAIGASRCAVINSNGVEFNAANEEGFAQASFQMPTETKDKVKFLEAHIGLTMLKLGEVEEVAAAALADLDAKFERIGGAIEIVE